MYRNKDSEWVVNHNNVIDANDVWFKSEIQRKAA